MNQHRKKRFIQTGFYFLSVTICSVGIVFGGTVLLTGGHPLDFFHFMKTYGMIKSNYFRPIDEDALWKGAARGMVESLGDPYSQVLSGDDYTSFMQSTSGEYGGIGIVMGLGADDKVQVFTVFSGSGAEKAGIQPGDELVSVDNQPVQELGLIGTAESVRGDNGTSVNLGVRRKGEILSFDVTRSNISLPTVSSRMETDGIGYIHIYTFSSHTPDEFKKQFSELKDQGCEKLIIDLRMNPGGMIDSVVAIADQILSSGTVVSYHAKLWGDKTYSVKGTDHLMPMAVLIDKNSASASEILAGAIQDKKEGTVIGETSYGKGTVQAVYQNGGKSAMKISIAEYRTPSGKSIDKIGIKPDIAVEQTGRLFSIDSDSVLEKAVEVLKEE